MASVRCTSRPGAYGRRQTLALMRAARAGPLWLNASPNAAYDTESTPVPRWLVVRSGQMLWMTRLLAPLSADVGCAPPVGCTTSSSSVRTVVHDVGPNVSRRPRRLNALSRSDPAACCQAAAGNRQLMPQLSARDEKAVVPCWVPASSTTSFTCLRNDGQYVSAKRASRLPWLIPYTAMSRPLRFRIWRIA